VSTGKTLDVSDEITAHRFHRHLAENWGKFCLTTRRPVPDHGDLHIQVTFANFPQQFSRLLVNIQHYLSAVRLRDCWNTCYKWYSLLRT